MQSIAASNLNDLPHSRMHAWAPVTAADILRFFAIRCQMDLKRMPDISDSWSKNPHYGDEIIRNIMPRDRYQAINRFFHFADNTQDVHLDRAFKIRQVWNLVIRNFKSVLVPDKFLTVDDSQNKSRNKSKLTQYSAKKRNRYGPKMFVLVDTGTRFILDALIYGGKDDQSLQRDHVGVGGSAVLRLMDGYLFRRRVLACDNYFCTPTLASMLLQLKTYIVGVWRKSKRLALVPLAEQRRMKRGDVRVFHSNQINVEVIKDKSVFQVLSTGIPHKLKVVKKYPKTKANRIYNVKSRGVDLTDAEMGHYSFKRRSRKW